MWCAMERKHLEDTIHVRIGPELREQLARLAPMLLLRSDF
jgi:hypothetical protein